MFKWNKLGQIFDPTILSDEHWMKVYAQAPSAVIFDNHVRVFFASRGSADPQGQYISRLGFIDLDRSNLLKVLDICKQPVLTLGERGTFDEFGTNPVSVIKDNDEIRAYYAGWTRYESVPFNAAIGLAISRDNGETFNRIGKGPVLSYTPDEPYVIGSPKIRKFNNKWYLWYSSGQQWVKNAGQPQPVYKIRMAVSEDGINWERLGRDLIENVLEDNECQASADVLFLGGRYHMFFSYRYNLNYRDPKFGYRIGYAYSDNLTSWTRSDKDAGIVVSDSGWDSESVSYPYVFELDSQIYMFYQGNDIGKYGFGLAKLNQEHK